MANAKSILEKIKAMFEDAAPLPYKLIDGTEITVDQLAVGGTVMIAGAPATANDYTLEDNTVIKVDADGKITEVIEPAAKVELSTHKLADGTEISVTALEVGGEVMIGEAKAPAGDHTLEDGRVITVDGEGKITAMKEKAAEDTDAIAAAAAAKFATGTPEERLANLEVVAKALMEYTLGWRIAQEENKATEDQAIAIYKQGLSAHENEVSALKLKLAKQDEILKQVLELAEALAKEPGEEPPAPLKKVFSNQNPNKKDKEDRLEKFREAATKFREAKLVK